MPRGSTLVHTAGGSPIPGVVSESALRAESFSSSQSLFSLRGAAKGRRPLMNGLYKKGPRGRPGALLESGQKSDVVVEHELHGCGRSATWSTSFLRLYSIQVSTTSFVKTPPSMRNAWSFSSASSDSPSEPGTDLIFAFSSPSSS